jgi:hypothetical protein
MFIRAVDEALEQMLRQGLPLPEQIGDVSFDPPSSNWSAQVSRITVNLFLCDIGPSAHPSRSPTVRADANGRMERRKNQPMIRMGYLVSAWGGTPRDEHQLLGDVISLLAGNPTIPPEMFRSPPSASVTASIVDDLIGGRLKDLWSGAGGQLKASFILQVDAAADTFDWQDLPPLVKTIDGGAVRVPPGSIRGNSLITEGAAAASKGAPAKG